MSDDTRDSGPEAGVKGIVEEVKGKVKEAAGALTGDKDLKKEGAAQQDKADSQREVAQKEAEADKARAEAAAHEAEQRSHQDQHRVKVAVAGASGFVGTALTQALCAAGHEVTALTRHPAQYCGAGTPAGADVQDGDALERVLPGHEAAYFLVHSLAGTDFVAKDRAAARTFAAAATEAGVGQVVYLGGLGDESDDLSDHLRSRREVESILLGEAPTTALRAGIVVGDGGISWEMLRQLVERLPVMITPRWVETRSQPIALDDVVVYLTGVLGRAEAIGRSYEVGGPEVMTYRDLMSTVARILHRRLFVVPVPLLSPRLSSQWLRLVTDVDLTTARALVNSMTNEVVVHDRSLDALVRHDPMRFEAAATRALTRRRERLAGEAGTRTYR